jgi:hypothetical protein
VKLNIKIIDGQGSEVSYKQNIHTPNKKNYIRCGNFIDNKEYSSCHAIYEQNKDEKNA